MKGLLHRMKKVPLVFVVDKLWNSVLQSHIHWIGSPEVMVLEHFSFNFQVKIMCLY